jgi:3-hydroxy-9,10-secoandrosta-1,3,5(10)-triene-9,17-dione monooxygenase reductase component
MLLASNNPQMTGNIVSASSEQTTKESLGKAIGRLASGVFIVTLQQDAEKHGVMATWVNQAAFEPPTITAAFNKERHFLNFLDKDVKFTVNVLSNKNMDIFKAFARPGKENDDRFDGLELLPNTNAGPVFAKVVAYLDCQVRQIIDAGDHMLTLATVIGGDVIHPDLEPMTHVRKNGFQY